MKIVYDDKSMDPKPEKYTAIKCFTEGCDRFIWSKSEIVKSHKGHDVRYCKKDGTPDD